MKKYEFTGVTKNHMGRILHQIKALVSFGDVKAGDLGGWIEKEENLSQDGDAWVYDDARVYGDARVHGDVLVYDNAWVYGNAWVRGNAWVCDNARVCGNAWVFDNAWVYGNAWVRGNARVCGNAWVRGNARVCGNAWVCGDADYLNIGPIGSRDDFTTFYRCKDGTTMVVCGCFHNTIDAFEKRVKYVHHGTSHESAYLAAIACARARVNTNPAEEETQDEESKRRRI